MALRAPDNFIMVGLISLVEKFPGFFVSSFPILHSHRQRSFERVGTGNDLIKGVYVSSPCLSVVFVSSFLIYSFNGSGRAFSAPAFFFFFSTLRTRSAGHASVNSLVEPPHIFL